jgi:putative ATP-dependent endonuclease of the OLD family
LAKACKDVGATKIAERLEMALSLDLFEEGLKKNVLSTAKRFGKARFAQIAARHADEAKELPDYIADAVKWLLS